MNVYGKIDEKQEGSHYQDWSVPEKREGAPIPFFSIMLWSLVAIAISVVLPFIFGVVSPQQSQDLYTGWALHQNGQMYTDYFGTNGLLYYLLTYLSLGSILLALVEWLALFGAGVFLFKSADALTGQAEEAKKLVFVLFVSGRTCFWWWLCSLASLAFPILFIEHCYELFGLSK